MGKRTLRIPGHKVASELPALDGQVVQAVMRDGKTHAGQVASASPTTLLLVDANASWTSRKRHSHPVQIAEIDFIVLDVISPW